MGEKDLSLIGFTICLGLIGQSQAFSLTGGALFNPAVGLGLHVNANVMVKDENLLTLVNSQAMLYYCATFTGGLAAAILSYLNETSVLMI